MKKNLILTCVLAFIVVIIVGITYGPYVVRKHLAHHGEPIKVEIPQGASASKIADMKYHYNIDYSISDNVHLHIV